MKKFLLIFILFLLTVVLFWGAYQWYAPKKETPIVTEEKSEEKIPSGIPPIETQKNSYEFPIRTNKGNIQVKDFRKNILESNSAGEMLLSNEKDYHIVYYGPDQSFLITLYALPIPETQKKAEDALLYILNISKEEVCKLKVSIGVPYQLDPNYIGVRLPLSFCSG
jgi:hypothetical protein